MDALMKNATVTGFHYLKIICIVYWCAVNYCYRMCANDHNLAASTHSFFTSCSMDHLVHIQQESISKVLSARSS